MRDESTNEDLRCHCLSALSTGGGRTRNEKEAKAHADIFWAHEKLHLYPVPILGQDNGRVQLNPALKATVERQQ